MEKPWGASKLGKHLGVLAMWKGRANVSIQAVESSFDFFEIFFEMIFFNF